MAEEAPVNIAGGRLEIPVLDDLFARAIRISHHAHVINQHDALVEQAGALDDAARLLEIANRCPVHRTLTSEIRIVTRLQDA